MASELRIARSIQMSIVPNDIPETPCRDRFDLAAFMEPARQVGGDFYDYFLLDPETLCLVIADVSGKGVAASLLMARSSSLFRSMAMNDRQLAVAVNRLNRILSQTNEACMFITFFAMSVHLPSGLCTYVNAGHNPPFLMRKGELPRLFDHAGALPLGVNETGEYREKTLQLGRDDLVFLYTDGVTEALDGNSALFGEERAEQSLGETETLVCTNIIDRLREAILAFVGETPQSDDITMLALRVFPEEANTMPETRPKKPYK